MPILRIDKNHESVRSCLTLLLFVVVGYIMLSFGWQKWPDILVDFGRELYIPWQINEGKVLYKDIVYFNGPLSPHLNALLFRVFGTNLMTIVFFNTFLVVVLLWIIYKIFLIIADKITAIFVCITFLTMFAFSQYIWTGNYNFVCPYSHEGPHGLLLSFISIYLFVIYLKRRSNLLIGIIGILMGLTFLTKVEIFISIFSAIFFGILFVMINTHVKLREVSKILCIFFIGLCLPIFTFVIYLSCHMPLMEVLVSITLQYRAIFNPTITSNIFYKRIMGVDDLIGNLLKLLSAFRWYIIFIAFLIIVCYVGKTITDKRYKKIFFFALHGILIVSAFHFITYTFLFDLLRPLPLVMALIGIYLLVSLYRWCSNYDQIRRILPMLMLVIFGFFLTFKILFNVRVYHYGFILAFPGTLLLTAFFVYQIPYSLDKISKPGFPIRSLILVFWGIIMVSHVMIAKKIYDLKTFPIGSGLDRFYTFHPHISCEGPCLRETLTQIEKIMGKGETFVVLPEGVMLNYLTRHRNPTPYFNFIPIKIEFFGEEKILKSFIKTKPDYIIIVERITSEYGYAYFGKDYAVKLFTWIKENYKPIWLVGSEPFTGKNFGIIIYSRKE